MTIKELRQKKAAKITEARQIVDAAENGVMTDEQKRQWDAAMAEAEALQGQVDRQERLEDEERKLAEPDPVRSRAGQEGGGEGTEQRGGVKAGRDRAREARKAHNTLRMLHGVTTRNMEVVKEAQRELAKDGWYGDQVQERAAGDYYSTLVDADGAILLPTEVVREIEEIGNIYGVARQLCSTFNHIVGTLKVPGATGTLNAAAVAEGAAITADMRSFQAISLNPKKWAIIVPWTYEANLEAGPQILADAQRAIARGFARAEDNALFNGNGTSTYNSIDGILSANRATVANYVMGSGDTSFDDIDADDIFMLRRKVPAAVRGEGVYVFHPDMEPKLRTLKDSNGAYIFAYNGDTGVATLGGRPVFYTEVLPAITADAISTTFGVFGAFSFFKMALGQGMSGEDLREASVTDADTGAAINLATQDLRALKVRSFFDMGCNFNTAFTKITTAAA